MPDNIEEIRVLKPGEDLIKSTISELMTQSLIDEYGQPPDKDNINHLIDYYYSRDDSIIFYLEKENMVAGFIWLIESSDVIIGNSFVCVLYLFVDEKFRGKKYSKLLMNKAIDYCKDKQIDDIRLTVRVKNPIAIKLYESMGFYYFKHEMSLKLDLDRKDD